MRQGEDQRVKSVKLRDLPTIGHLMAEHDLLLEKLASICSQDNDLDLRTNFPPARGKEELACSLVHISKPSQLLPATPAGIAESGSLMGQTLPRAYSSGGTATSLPRIANDAATLAGRSAMEHSPLLTGIVGQARPGLRRRYP